MVSSSRSSSQRKPAKYLRLVDSAGEDVNAYLVATAGDNENVTNKSEPGDPGPVPEPETADIAPDGGKHDADTVIGNAVMYAAMSWVACCMERAGESVSVASLGGGIFDAEVSLSGGGSTFLRVTLDLGVGPRLRTMVEPIHP